MIVVKKINEYGVNDFYNLFENSWSGARDTLEAIIDNELETEFMEHLEEEFGRGNEVEDTELNDYIWFEREYIYKSLGLNENGELIEEEN